MLTHSLLLLSCAALQATAPFEPRLLLVCFQLGVHVIDLCHAAKVLSTVADNVWEHGMRRALMLINLTATLVWSSCTVHCTLHETFAGTTCQLLPCAGGLLSSHIMLERQPSAVPGYNGVLLRLATDLGNRLLPAFDTRSGIPLSWINLRKVRGTVA